MLSALLITLTVLAVLDSSVHAVIGASSTSLSSFTAGSDGIVLSGYPSGQTGVSVAQIGDYNNDGLEDFAVSAPYSTVNSVLYSGLVFIVLGHTGNGTAIELATASSDSTMRRITSSSSSVMTGASVGKAGDVNNDGFADVLLSAPNFNYGGTTTTGVVFLIYGVAGPYTDVFIENLFTASAVGYAIVTSQQYALLAGYPTNTRGLGDLNGDGFDDFAISSPQYDFASRQTAGAVWIIYGRATPATVYLESLGSAGIVIGGAAASEFTGYSIDNAGDFNLDGINDLVIGANAYDPVVGGSTRTNAGAAYVIYGSASMVSRDLLSFTTGAAGVRYLGAANNDGTGTSVCGAGDVNDDGYADILVGAPRANGIVYVLFGTSAVLSGDVDLLALVPGARGFKILGGGGTVQLGIVVSSAGDLNTDGIADFAAGGAGTIYVFYGTTTVPTANVNLATASDFYTIVSSGSASALDGGSDVNGDGYPDLVVGLKGAGTPAGQGMVYVVYGPLPRANTFSPTMQPTRPSAAPTLLPSAQPSSIPSAAPTLLPSAQPSAAPSAAPSSQPSSTPTEQPSSQPSARPSSSAAPSSMPTVQPTVEARAGSDGSSPPMLSAGGIAGVVVGGVLFLILLVLLVVFVFCANAAQSQSAPVPVTGSAPPAQGYEMTQVQEA
mgnify:CR=1 FL=1